MSFHVHILQKTKFASFTKIHPSQKKWQTVRLHNSYSQFAYSSIR